MIRTLILFLLLFTSFNLNSQPPDYVIPDEIIAERSPLIGTDWEDVPAHLRDDDLIVEIEGFINEPPHGWCDWLPGDYIYEATSTPALLYDVHKHVNIPYVNDNNTFGNDNLDNHNFWYYFGFAGKDYCLDDDLQNNKFKCDPFDYYGLKCSNVYFGAPTTLWIDLATQCEDCDGGAYSGKGHWYKWEENYEANELFNFKNDCFVNAYTRDDVDLEFQGKPDCDVFTNYGCGDDETIKD